MRITLDDKTKHSVEKAAQHLGINEAEIGRRALLFYLSALKDEIALADEFSAWERMSDESLLAMDKQLQAEV